jgi:hypothetical protein
MEAQLVRRCLPILILALMAIPLLALPGDDPVAIVTTAHGPTLWLPAQTSQAAQAAAAGEVARYQEAWTGFFGSPPPLPDPLTVSGAGSLPEELFAALWQACAPGLRPEEREGAASALRAVVLDDPAPLLVPVARALSEGRLDGSLLSGPLPYLFFRSEVQTKGFLPKALPPGPGASRLRAALANQGVSWNQFWNRFTSWIVERGLRYHLLSTQTGTLPAVWLLDSDLAPGQFTAWRFQLSEVDEGVGLQVAGGAPSGIRLLSFYTDGAGRVIQSGVCDLKGPRLLFPRNGRTLWLVLLNDSDQSEGADLTMTLWKEVAPPFTVRRASLDGKSCDLFVEEQSGVAFYDLTGRSSGSEKFTSLGIAPFPSEGGGNHHYRLPIQGSQPNLTEIRLTCTTLAGGTYAATAPLSPSDSRLP